MSKVRVEFQFGWDSVHYTTSCNWKFRDSMKAIRKFIDESHSGEDFRGTFVNLKTSQKEKVEVDKIDIEVHKTWDDVRIIISDCEFINSLEVIKKFVLEYIGGDIGSTCFKVYSLKNGKRDKEIFCCYKKKLLVVNNDLMEYTKRELKRTIK